MIYEELPVSDFFLTIANEQQAVEMAWRYKTADQVYSCPKCSNEKYYQHKLRPEIRECSNCKHQHRLRVSTIFQNSKTPMLTWVRGIYLMMMGKRGMSALELQRQLKIKCYKTSGRLLRKVRCALMERDSSYQLKGLIELDGGKFGKMATGNQEEVLIAVESKQWRNEKGEDIERAGFAKVYIGKEDNHNAQIFMDTEVQVGSEVHTDAARAYLCGIDNFEVKSKGMYGDHKRLEEWLPWVHRFISNAKAWIIGTHHGVTRKYFKYYLAEYTYRFNRRHDSKRYFSRALFACLRAA